MIYCRHSLQNVPMRYRLDPFRRHLDALSSSNRLKSMLLKMAECGLEAEKANTLYWTEKNNILNPLLRL